MQFLYPPGSVEQLVDRVVVGDFEHVADVHCSATIEHGRVETFLRVVALERGQKPVVKATLCKHEWCLLDRERGKDAEFSR